VFFWKYKSTKFHDITRRLFFFYCGGYRSDSYAGCVDAALQDYMGFPLIMHNCLAAKSVNVRMIVHNQCMADKYCSVCTCEKFMKKNCPSPRKGKSSNSEKLHWIRDAIERYREFIFLDADLIVMYPREFFYGMAARALW